MKSEKDQLINIDCCFAITPEALSSFFVEDKIRNGESKEMLDQRGGVEQLMQELKVNKQEGLSNKNEQDLNNRRKQFGTNDRKIIPAKKFFSLLLDSLSEPIIIMLLIAACVSAAVESTQNPTNAWMDATGILFAVIIVSTVGASTEYTKDQQFRKLHASAEERQCMVKRDRDYIKISVYDLLVGDIVSIKDGEKIPVDGILLSCQSLQVDESSINGESEPVYKNTEASCFVLSGTNVIEGSGKFLVCAVGKHTYSGKAQQLVNSVNEEEEEGTPLQQKLENAAVQMGWFGLILAAFLFVILILKMLFDLSKSSEMGHVESQLLIDALIEAILLVVIIVPEGWPLAVTLSLAFSVNKMKEEQNLVRHLHACEVMGAASEVLSDKTGTLTKNKLYLVNYQLCGTNNVKNLEQHVQDAIFEGIAINSTALVSQTNAQQNSGNPIEQALLKFAMSNKYENYEQLREQKLSNQNQYWIKPFNSSSKMSSCCIKTNQGARIYCKGAPEIIIKLCTRIQVGSQILEFTEQQKENVIASFDGVYRNIALSYSDINDNFESQDLSQHNLVFLGYVNLEDPVRPGVKNAIQQLTYKNYIKVRMVTGDSVQTATEVALQVGIIPDRETIKKHPNTIMTGEQFREIVGDFTYKDKDNSNIPTGVQNLKEFQEIEPNLLVLARSSPMDKFKFVLALKELGRVVAVTGDGTNDAPALRRADVGFSMHLVGTEIAKEASDIIMLDDDFRCIVTATKWGRNTIHSVRKFLTFWMCTTLTFLFVVFLGTLTNAGSIFTPVQVLYVNMIQDSLAALALATEKPSEELLKKRPEGRGEKLYTIYMWRHIVSQVFYQCLWLTVVYLKMELFVDTFIHPDREATFFFNVFMWMNIFNLLYCRNVLSSSPNFFSNMSNNVLFCCVFGLELILQPLIIEFGGTVLECYGLSSYQHLTGFLIGVGGLCFSTLFRLIPLKAFSLLDDLYI